MQDHPNCIAIARRVIDAARGAERPMGASERRLSTDRYRDPAVLDREREILFRRYPLPLAHASELAGPGTCLTRDVCGLPVLLTRDAEGAVHAFLNACRHRGTRLVLAEEGCERKALVCPYHGWTYGLDGRLRHLPQAEAFPSLRRAEIGLVALPIVERHGLLWVRPSAGPPFELAGHLGPIGAELDSFDLSGHVLYKRASARRRANWKLVAENFLEGYHVRQLHKHTLYRFFLDSLFAIERAGLHQRAAVGRKEAALSEERALLDRVTLTYFLFPNTNVVISADYINLIAFFPIAVDEVLWQHALLVPASRAGERELYERAFTLMEDRTFSGEDVTIAEEVQAGIAAGADPSLLFGRLEEGPLWFHETVDQALAVTP